MKREKLEELFEGIEFRNNLEKCWLFKYLEEYAFDILIESDEVVIDDGESYLYFKNPFTGSFYNISITEFLYDLKVLYKASDTESYDHVIHIMNSIEDTCNYVYEDLYKKLKTMEDK